MLMLVMMRENRTPKKGLELFVPIAIHTLACSYF